MKNISPSVICPCSLGIFGSVRYSEHLLFKECSREHNNGIPLGFVNPSECKTQEKLLLHSGFFVSRAHYNSASSSISKSKNEQASSCCTSERMCLGFLFTVHHTFYPIMRFVLLADSKIPCMHLLKYFLRQEDCMMREHLQKVELAYYAIPPHIRTIMGDPSNYDIMHTDTTPSKKVPQKSVGS